MIRFLAFFSFVIIIPLQCSKNRSTIEIIDFPLSINGEAAEIIIEPILLSIEDLIVTENNLLVAMGNQKDKLFHVFYTPNCKYIGSFGKIGRGPGEFSKPLTNTFGVIGDYIYIVDNNIYKKISIDVTNTSIETNVLEKIILPGKAMAVNGIVQKDESSFVGVTSNNYISNEFFLFDKEKKTFKGVGDYPELIESPYIKPFTNFHLYVKHVDRKPDGSKVVALYSNFKFMRLFDNELNLIGSYQLENPKKQTIEVKPEGTISTSNSYIYYLDLAVTDKYIYGLNIGRKYGEIPSNPEIDFDTYLHIWDWNGEPFAEITLPNTDFKIAVDSEDKYLYTLNPYKKDVIFRYDLQELVIMNK